VGGSGDRTDGAGRGVAPERYEPRQLIGLALAVSVFALMLVLPPPDGLEPTAWRVAAVAVLMAVLWLSEGLPIPVTALLPLVLFPVLGVGPIEQAASPYANPLVFLFLGGFIIALAIERWNLHRRIALSVIHAIGAREDLQVAGFMLATALLSMWVSNTATTVMMLPVAMSIVPKTANGDVDPARRGFATALLLSLAYAANIGGMATLIGTPPNAFLAGFMLENYGVQIGFAEWMVLAVPISIVMFIVCWVLLTRVQYRLSREELPGARRAIAEALRSLGPASRAEKRVAIVFAATALLWITRPVIDRFFPGLMLSDTGVALLGALALFVIPSGRRRGEFLMNWRTAEKLPWGVLLLFGGGLSLAAAVSGSGLAAWIGASLGAFANWPSIMVVVLVATLIVFLTELTSNLATTATFLPVVAALAISIDYPPLYLAIPAVLAASWAFMMPVATPPNAIVFASGHITIPQMVRAGLVLNLIGVGVIVAAVYLLIGPVFGV
jgi:solute carrier family 13 (sodium-dependent dicarboxylate transporter), member 2/3/5